MTEKFLNKIIKLYYATVGFLLFHLFKKKELVYVASSMRSGSTLLKALLGQAKDVSHLEEKQFLLISRYKNFNKYINYYKAYFFSYKHQVIVYKTPVWSLDKLEQYPYLPLSPVKLILLTRNPNDIVKSLIQMDYKLNLYKDNESARNYVYLVYRRMSELYEDSQLQTKLVSYEELIRAPEIVSLNLLSLSKPYFSTSILSAPHTLT